MTSIDNLWPHRPMNEDSVRVLVLATSSEVEVDGDTPCVLDPRQGVLLNEVELHVKSIGSGLVTGVHWGPALVMVASEAPVGSFVLLNPFTKSPLPDTWAIVKVLAQSP